MKANYKPIKTLYVNLETLEKIYLDKESKLLDYSRIGVDFGVGKMNISHIMYSQVSHSRAGSTNVYVLHESYCEKNKIIIDSIIELLLSDKQRGDSAKTLNSTLRLFKIFLNWERGNTNGFPIDIIGAKRLYEKYSLSLRQRMRLKGGRSLAQRTAHAYQAAALKLLREIFNDNNNIIKARVPTIVSSKRLSKATAVDDKDVEYAFNFYYRFFEQVADFLLNGKPYPLKLSLPGSLLWVIPERVHWTKPPHVSRNSKPLYFDYEKGAIPDENELIKRMKERHGIKSNKPWTEDYARKALRRRKAFIQKIERANDSVVLHEERLKLGARAMSAYYMVMLAITGMNDRVLGNMKWEDDYEVDKGMQGFKAIKPRAKYKQVRFEIQNEFIDGFKKFLALRKFLLQGSKNDNLFFAGYGKKAKVTVSQKVGTRGSGLYGTVFSKLDKNLPAVESRKFRVYKTKWVLNKEGEWHASVISQSSISTILDHYHGESDEAQEEQVLEFINQVHDKVVDQKSEREDCVDTGAGGCIDYGNPLAEAEGISEKIDCFNQKGCLFCSKYRCHPDEEDIRKLFSMEYIINEVTVVNAQDTAHFKRVMGPTLNRIEAIKITLQKKHCGLEVLMQEIRSDVYENENLSPYWEMKMKSLYDLGVVR